MRRGLSGECHPRSFEGSFRSVSIRLQNEGSPDADADSHVQHLAGVSSRSIAFQQVQRDPLLLGWFFFLRHRNVDLMDTDTDPVA